MDSDASGWLWLSINVAMVAAFAGALIYGTRMWHKWRRDPRDKRRRDEAIKELYQRGGNE